MGSERLQGGLCFHTRGRIFPGKNIRIHFPLRSRAQNTRGKIAWCRRDSNGQYLVGVFFEINVHRDTIQHIQRIEDRRLNLQAEQGLHLTSEEVAEMMHDLEPY